MEANLETTSKQEILKTFLTWLETSRDKVDIERYYDDIGLIITNTRGFLYDDEDFYPVDGASVAVKCIKAKASELIKEQINKLKGNKYIVNISKHKFEVFDPVENEKFYNQRDTLTGSGLIQNPKTKIYLIRGDAQHVPGHRSETALVKENAEKLERERKEQVAKDRSERAKENFGHKKIEMSEGSTKASVGKRVIYKWDSLAAMAKVHNNDAKKIAEAYADGRSSAAVYRQIKLLKK